MLKLWYSASLNQFPSKMFYPADSGQTPSKRLGWVRLPHGTPLSIMDHDPYNQPKV